MTNAIVEINLHGLRQDEAQLALDEALRRADGSVYRIRVIHGYTRGTALRDMILSEYRWHERVVRIEAGPNRGQTDLILREY
ncbi:MAG: Smr/MutS family protein [Clostridia bacterium]|nr:Smr/MutS family protein [Clostridia bacterium]